MIGRLAAPPSFPSFLLVPSTVSERRTSMGRSLIGGWYGLGKKWLAFFLLMKARPGQARPMKGKGSQAHEREGREGKSRDRHEEELTDL